MDAYPPGLPPLPAHAPLAEVPGSCQSAYVHPPRSEANAPFVVAPDWTGAVRGAAHDLRGSVSREVADGERIAEDAREVLHDEPCEDDVALGIQVPPVQDDLAVAVVDEDAADGVQVAVAVEVDVDDRNRVIRRLAGPREAAVLDPIGPPPVQAVQVLVVIRVVLRPPGIVRRRIGARDDVELV